MCWRQIDVSVRKRQNPPVLIGSVRWIGPLLTIQFIKQFYTTKTRVIKEQIMQMILIHLPRINVLKASNTWTEVQSNSHGNSSAMTTTAIVCHSICSSATNLERKTSCEKSCQLSDDPDISSKTGFRWPHNPQSPHVTLLSLEIWTPRNAYLKACRVPGYVRRDKQIYIINGGVGCVEGWSNEDRLGFYKRCWDLLGVSHGDNLRC